MLPTESSPSARSSHGHIVYFAYDGSLPKPGGQSISDNVHKVKRKALKTGNSGKYRDGSSSSKTKRRNSTKVRIYRG